jgi:prevent-host-death family protein
MIEISLERVRQDLDAILDRVEAGQPMVIVRDGKPVAELRPPGPASAQPRPFGLCAGELTVPADFDAPLPESVLMDFEGR